MQAVKSWTYPGNVRELQNAMERAVALSVGNVLRKEDLPDVIWETGAGFVAEGGELPEEGLRLGCSPWLTLKESGSLLR